MINAKIKKLEVNFASISEYRYGGEMVKNIELSFNNDGRRNKGKS